MESMFAQYLKERTNDFILETPDGFVTYRYLEDEKTVYIVDIFVLPKIRKEGIAAKMADEVVKEAKERGCTALVGSVVPSTRFATRSVQVLIGYGMLLHSSSNDFIVFKKEI